MQTMERFSKALGAVIAALGFFGLMADAQTAYGFWGELAWIAVCLGLMAAGGRLAGCGNIFKNCENHD